MSNRYWNYRVVRFVNELNKNDVSLAICEVHYEDGKPIAYSLESVAWDEDQPEAGADILRRMNEALLKPILSEAEAMGRP